MRVAIAMSGGVDSSVAAALLVDAGHDVVGVSMRICGAEQGDGRAGTCCTIDDLHDARRVARQLGIPHHMVDLGRRFADVVIGDFVAEYARGRTPIPCAHCNSQLKFSALVEQAVGLDAAWIATGHYARVTRDDAGVFHLWRGADDRKDQTYFLFALTQSQLARAMFPVGALSKDEVRRIALERELQVAEKPDSQEICFVPDGDYAAFVERRLPADRAGLVVDSAGRVVGRHDGVHRFTIGQRKGLGIASGEPLYVLRLDAGNKLVIVGPRQALEQSVLTASGVTWTAGAEPDGALEADVQIRSRHAASPARVDLIGPRRVRVEFDAPQSAVTPGQAAVFFRGDELLGGGWID
jgi:tRNA-specific 2-thiouridylase